MTISGVHTDKFLNAELNSGPGMMATYVMRFLAILSRSGSIRHHDVMICPNPLQAPEVFARKAGF